MADPIVVGQINTRDFSGIDRLDDAIAHFGPGDRGQITLPLDPEIAIDEGYSHFVTGTAELNAELRTQGLRPWPGQRDIATLDWRNRNVYIRFTSTSSQGIPAQAAQAEQDWLSGDRYTRVPSAVFLTGILSRLVVAAGGRIGASRTVLAMTQKTGHVLGKGATFPARSSVINAARTSMKASLRGLRLTGTVATLLPVLAALTVGGAIIFFALNPDKLIEVLKWVGTKAVEGATALGRKAADALGLDDKMGMLVLAGGLLAGGFLFMRRKR